jgi:hypothetical protein
MENEITKLHADYCKSSPDWEQIQTCIDGERAIKACGEVYLPYPVSLEDKDRKSKDFESQYKIYKNGAHFVNFTADAVHDLTAAAFRTPVKVDPDLPSDLEYMDVSELAKKLLPLVSAFGRAFILVDYPTVENSTVATDKENKAYYEIYAALDVINWSYGRVSGQKKVTMVVLRELLDSDTCNEIEYQYRELLINEAGYYQQTVFNESGEIIQEPFEPIAAGNKLREIPGIFVGVESNTPDVDKPPVIGISNSNLKHYQTMAELAWVTTYTGHPQLVLTGLMVGWNDMAEKKNMKVVLDAAKVLALEGETAAAQLLEINSSNLIHFKNLELLERMMQEQGLMLKGGMYKNGVESAEAIKIRYSSEISTLGKIVENVENACLFTIDQMGLFMSATYTGEVVINKEFVTPTRS